jgi:predicted unusual protein kinase regulating ubiquinone biosynthesis (AarF/ABC1/UbiB family)
LRSTGEEVAVKVQRPGALGTVSKVRPYLRGSSVIEHNLPEDLKTLKISLMAYPQDI